MKTTSVVPDWCPHCGRRIEGVTDPVGQHTPAPGDISICIRCLRLMQFDKNLRVQKLHPDEEYRAMRVYGRQIDRMRAALVAVQGSRN